MHTHTIPSHGQRPSHTLEPVATGTLSGALPPAPGVGFKSRHFGALMDDPGAVGWVEVHAENYMGDGGRPLAMLDALRERFPLSVHGVGLSIGGDSPLDATHLARLRRLVDRVEPASFSEHLAWSTHEGAYLNDLLPLPYTQATLDRICAHIDTVQTALGRRMLLENPSSYLAFATSTMEETSFLDEVARRTGCGLLLDVNNVFVSAVNLGIDPRAYIAAFPLDKVEEIHLAGHDTMVDGHGAPLLIDAHGCPVAEPVWALFGEVLARAGARPSLIEWDNEVPAWEVLHAEAARAGTMLDAARTKGMPDAAQRTTQGRHLPVDTGALSTRPDTDRPKETAHA